MDYWETKYYGDDKLVIFDDEDVESLGLRRLYRDIDPNEAWDACESKKYLSPDDLEWRLKQPNVIVKQDEVCFTKAIYINEIPNF